MTYYLARKVNNVVQFHVFNEKVTTDKGKAKTYDNIERARTALHFAKQYGDWQIMSAFEVSELIKNSQQCVTT